MLSRGQIVMMIIHRFGRVARWTLALSVASIALAGCKSEARPEGPPPQEVSVIEVKPGPVTVYNEYVAQTQSSQAVNISARVSGFLDKRVYTEGAVVKAGQVLFQMDQKPFQAQVDAAKAAMARNQAGMDVARLNFSHGTHEAHAATIALLRAAALKQGKTISILADLQGPKIRTGALAGGQPLGRVA